MKREVIEKIVSQNGRNNITFYLGGATTSGGLASASSTSFTTKTINTNDFIAKSKVYKLDEEFIIIEKNINYKKYTKIENKNYYIPYEIIGYIEVEII